MRTAYKLEMFAVIVGIIIVAMLAIPNQLTFTGYVSGLNLTIYEQSLNLTVDGSQSYALTSETPLHLRSFMLDGEVVGNGRVEIFLDNGNNQQFLVYQNVKSTSPYTGPSITGISSGLTGMAINPGDIVNEQKGVFLVIQPTKQISYEFAPLKPDEEVISGYFNTACAETCNMPKFLFDSYQYTLIFRIEKGTLVNINEVKYILQEENA